jgi:hypothetical protein
VSQTDTNEAQQYSATISEEIEALNALTADPYEKDLREALLSRLEFDHLDPTLDGWEILSVWLNESVLDVSVQIDTRKDTLNGRVVLLRTVGGPRCEVVREYGNGDTVEVLTWWAGEYGRSVVWASQFAHYLDQLIESHHDY